jgi:hypothetical protein
MGEVFLATDLTLERLVALKILPPTLLGDADRVRRFVQEAKSASALNHPNIVTIYEIGQSPVTPLGGQPSEDRTHYMAMEYIEGQTLREMIYGDAPLKDVIGVLAQAADGLAKAHGAGIVHRDLKPDNIMITSDGYAKVVDFGLAKLTEKKPDLLGGGGGQEKSITQSGMVMGTVGYMSPEQIDGSMIRPPSDIFAFGCILYEAVVKRRPFQSDLAIDTLHKIMFSEAPPMTMYAVDAPPGLQAVVDRCLKKKAEERYANMREVAIALREFSGSGGTTRPQAALAPGYAPPPQSGGIVRPKIAVRPLDTIDDEERRPRSAPARIASLAFKLLLLALAATLIYVGATLPDVSALAQGKPDGIAFWTDYDDIAPSLRRSTVVSLDPDFFERRAIRTRTLAAAAKSISTPERRLYAPSPLAREVAQAMYGGSSANPASRVRGWAIAATMHSKLSDRRILELYLNLARYGDAVGVTDASKRFFKKAPRRLTEDESAMLAAAAVTAGADPANPTPELTAVRQSILAKLQSGGEPQRVEKTEPKKSSGSGRKSKKGGSKTPATTTSAPTETQPAEPPAVPEAAAPDTAATP